MTAKTSQRLADALRKAGFEDLAKKAEADLYHDYLSPDAMAATALDRDLVHKIETSTGVQRTAATFLRERHHSGDFDASTEESDEWATSAEGQAAFRGLMRGQP